jgi:hypothetical protein
MRVWFWTGHHCHTSSQGQQNLSAWEGFWLKNRKLFCTVYLICLYSIYIFFNILGKWLECLYDCWMKWMLVDALFCIILQSVSVMTSIFAFLVLNKIKCHNIFFFQGKSQQQAVKHLSQLYWPVVTANWKWFSLLQFINFTFVHPMVSSIK